MSHRSSRARSSAVQGVHGQNRPVKRPGQLAEQHDPMVAPMDVRKLMDQHVAEFILADRLDQPFGQDDSWSPEPHRDRCDRSCR